MVNAQTSSLIQDYLDKHSVSFNEIPSAIIIYDLRDWNLIFMNKSGLERLNLSLEALLEIPTQDFFKQFFNPQDAAYYVPKIQQFVAEGNSENINFFQQLRFPDKDGFAWYLTYVSIPLYDTHDKPLLCMAISSPIDEMHHLANRANQILSDNLFIKKNMELYLKLSKRERNILGEIAQGKTSNEIAQLLNISSATVDTHRRNIRSKLHVKSMMELNKFARVFDLL